MNVALAISVPPVAVAPVAVVAEVTCEAVDMDAQHQAMIRTFSELGDTLYEELTPHSVALMEGLVEQFRSQLTRCQASLSVQGEGGAKGL